MSCNQMIAMTQATPRFASFEAYLSSNGDLEGRYYINNRAQYAALHNGGMN